MKMKGLMAAAVLAAGSATAFAHGEKLHEAAPAIDYSQAEETAFGRAADPKTAQRTIRMDMSDQMRFTPAALTVKQGETVRFVVTNKGQVLHEMVLGTMEELKKHAELMRKHPGMEHDEPHMAHVAAGKSGEMGWQFTKAGEFFYGCLIPGHFEAGMIGKVVVTKGEPQHGAAASQPSDAAAQHGAPLIEGEVRRVDKDAGKITIRHGAMPHLDMPAMTMVFQVKDPAMLEQVKAGDKVRFQADKTGGAFTLLKLEPLT